MGDGCMLGKFATPQGLRRSGAGTRWRTGLPPERLAEHYDLKATGPFALSPEPQEHRFADVQLSSVTELAE
jgi:hypothetical protein